MIVCAVRDQMANLRGEERDQGSFNSIKRQLLRLSLDHLRMNCSDESFLRVLTGKDCHSK